MNYETKKNAYVTRVGLLEELKTSSVNEAPWLEFKQIYWDLITGWAKLYGCTGHQIHDIFQETMFCLVRDIRDIDNLRQEGGFRHYLRKLVLHSVIDALSREPLEKEKEKDFPATDLDEDKLWKKSVVSKALKQASKDAGLTAYHAFCYVDLDGMSVDSAAKKLATSNEKISSLRSTFLNTLKEDCHKFMSSMEEEGLIDELIGPDNEFIETVKGFASGQVSFKHTIASNIDLPPVKLLDRMNFLENQLKDNPVSTNNTTNLLLITRREKELPKDKDDNNLEIDFKDKVVASKWIKLKHYQMIGRVDTCRISLQGEGISRFHASIVEKSNGWILKDEHSTNGVYVNGKKIEETVLKNGDIIQVSQKHLMIFSQRTLNEYMDLQLKYLRWWSRHFNVSLEQSAWDWVKTGLAAKFAGKYRSQPA